MRRVESIVLAGTAAAILVGLAGTIVPRLPGVALIWAAVLVWASIQNTATAWIVLAIASVLAVASYLIQQLLAGRPPAELIAPANSLLIGAAAAAVGYLLARALGLLAGFAAGTYFAERRRLRRAPAARTPVRAPARERTPVGREAAVELAAGLLVTAAWITAVAG